MVMTGKEWVPNERGGVTPVAPVAFVAPVVAFFTTVHVNYLNVISFAFPKFLIVN